MEEGEIKEIVNQAEVSLILDTYNDIFSSFDPRPYNERSLSEDLLSEAKRAVRDKGEGIELRFIIPKAQRSIAHETLIKQRLKDHFRKHHYMVQRELTAYKKQAVTLIAVGTIIGFIAVWLSITNIYEILKHAVEIILSPASWFTIWTGFEHLTFPPKKETQEEQFYRKMIDAHISFTGY
ncbi:MAG TPA: hypothetical protein VHA12_04395 [Candidatus Nanoarchaeia archaeon]|nr:hypothetical protein [Candidatus Nanoarchaeia archaeon]